MFSTCVLFQTNPTSSLSLFCAALSSSMQLFIALYLSLFGSCSFATLTCMLTMLSMSSGSLVTRQPSLSGKTSLSLFSMFANQSLVCLPVLSKYSSIKLSMASSKSSGGSPTSRLDICRL